MCVCVCAYYELHTFRGLASNFRHQLQKKLHTAGATTTTVQSRRQMRDLNLEQRRQCVRSHIITAIFFVCVCVCVFRSRGITMVVVTPSPSSSSFLGLFSLWPLQQSGRGRRERSGFYSSPGMAAAASTHWEREREREKRRR